MRLKNLFLVVFFLFASQRSFSQNLEFYREDLNFEIKPGLFIVDGYYYFSNSSDKPVHQILIYPFPVNDSLYGPVSNISIIDMAEVETSKIMALKSDNAIFAVDLAPYESTKYQIHYEQDLLKNQAEYILTTTGRWKKPLEHANYSLKVPDSLKILFFSYTADSCKNTSNSNTYYWKKTDFMPDKNMIFRY